MSLKSGKMHRPGMIKPIKARLTDEELRQRAAKTEVRAQISREHAITRGIAMGAYNNTTYLRKWQRIHVGLDAAFAVAALTALLRLFGVL